MLEENPDWYNVYRWAAKIVSMLLRIDPADNHGAPPVANDALPFPDRSAGAQLLAIAAGTW